MSELARADGCTYYYLPMTYWAGVAQQRMCLWQSPLSAVVCLLMLKACCLQHLHE
jgi:hypothetical protein